ncbi:MAG: hypothetical protein Unbinned1693contig1002_40 [Prokaryotic dsDNA virus sp.]|jgi:hypothetical protein|nr:MAG: hypothetical protein Unbinned1693contig1002_40 [Prokaryotic dsDNA virus sp.]|tara:strand:+ start:919 stop:1803 length:885 start_codon:yes stop_codon:yes gene_type:complete
MANGSIITNNGKKVMLNRAYKASPDYNAPDQFKVGADNGTPNVGSTDLDNPIPISDTEMVDDCEAADWTDDAEMSTTLDAVTFKEGSNSLSLTKDAGAAIDATTDKTTTSRDFTSKELWIWLYIKDATMYAKLNATDCVTIRFGSDNANYYQYTRDKADLATGWNYIYFNSGTADSTVGAPVIAACDYSYIGIKADAAGTTWSAGDLLMDDWKVASADDYFQDIDASYPSLDETNHQVEIRCTLATTDANGYDIDGFSIWNDDGTELMLNEDTFTAESKSSTDEFVFIVKDRIE